MSPDKRKVRNMETYVKAILYLYPKLTGLIKDGQEHIENKAVASFMNKQSPEKLYEAMAEEVIKRNKLMELKALLDEIYEELTKTEKYLVEMRYLRRKRYLKKAEAEIEKSIGSKRTYFRRQERLIKKVQSRLALKGLNEEVFQERFLNIDAVSLVCRYLQKKGDEIGQKEEQAFENSHATMKADVKAMTLPSRKILSVACVK